MDLIRFRKAATALLDSLGERLTAHDQDWFRGYLWAGEEGLLADELATALNVDRTPIASAERELLRELLWSFDLDDMDPEYYPSLCERDRVVAALNIVGS
jgi:hypothetical protein